MRAPLDDICQAIGLSPTDAQADTLLQYLALLQRWNTTYNLTAVRDPREMLIQHLADCLALIPSLQRHMGAAVPQPRVLDVGSGGGLPGVVIAVMLPVVDVTCVDSVGKKVAFVRQVAGALKLPRLHALHGRIEQIDAPAFDVITSRAFASLADFTRLTRRLLSDDGVWVAMKARTRDGEIAAVPADVEVFHVEPLQVPELDAERCLIWMRRAPHAI